MFEANWEQVPLGWPRPTGEILRGAKQATLDSLSMLGLDAADGRLAAYYDRRSDHPGTSFAGVEPVCANRFTAADLYAVSLLGVQVPAGAARRLVEAGPEAQHLCRLVRDIPVGWQLRTAGPAQLTRMVQLHRELKLVLAADGTAGEQRWATASALCARKRPALFPVRGAGVRRLLGVLSLDDVRIDWQVYRGLLQDSEVERAVATVVDSAHELRPPSPVDASWLRLLDVVLSTYARSHHGAQQLVRRSRETPGRCG